MLIYPFNSVSVSEYFNAVSVSERQRQLSVSLPLFIGARGLRWRSYSDSCTLHCLFQQCLHNSRGNVDRDWGSFASDSGSAATAVVLCRAVVVMLQQAAPSSQNHVACC